MNTVKLNLKREYQNKNIKKLEIKAVILSCYGKYQKVNSFLYK